MTTTEATTKRITIRCQFCQRWNRVEAARAGDRPKCGECGRPLLLDRPVPLGDEDFERTIAESDLPVLVDFYADWCGPCKMMAPQVDELARQWQGRAVVAKLNTERAIAIAQKFDIRSIPTSIVFVKGKEITRQTGAVPGRILEEMLRKA